MTSLNRNLIIKALEAQIDAQPKDTLDGLWTANRLKEQVVLLQTEKNAYLLLQKEGGSWLGYMREWIKWNAINGDSVTWNTEDALQLSRPLSVRSCEELAAHVAAAAMNDLLGLR